MRIRQIEIFDAFLKPGWNPVFVRIHAGELHGTGEMAPAYSPCIRAAVKHLEQAASGLLGRDPFQIQALSAGLLSGAFGQPSLECGHAASALDIALHDLKGKALGVPAYELLGGRVRDSIRAYANGWCYDRREPGEYAEAARAVVEAGFTAMKFDPFRYSEGGFDWAIQSPGAAPRSRWMKLALARVQAVRDAVGPDVDILLEAHGRFDPPTARYVADAFRGMDLFWFEEPTGNPNPAVLADVAARSSIPIATGERLVGREAFRPFLEQRACAILQPDLGMAGGLTEGRAIAEHARHYGVFLAPHNAGGPVCTAASLHLDLATPNFLIQEIFPFRPHDYFGFAERSIESQIRNGFIDAPSAPGLGVELDASRIQSLPAIRVG